MKRFLSAMGAMAMFLLLAGTAGAAAPTFAQVNVGADGNSVSALNVVVATSSDGHYILFDSGLSPFLAEDTNDVRDTYVRDMQTGTVERADVSSSGAQTTTDFGFLRDVGLDISDDGRFVLFGSRDALTPGAGTAPHYYVRDRVLHTTELIDVSDDGTEAGPDSFRFDGSISSDGRYVAFLSDAGNIVPGAPALPSSQGTGYVFVRDRGTQTTVLATTDAAGNPVAVPGSNPSSVGDRQFELSDNGRYLTFISSSSQPDLVPMDTNGLPDIYRKDLQTGILALVSADAVGNAIGNVTWEGASADGTRVAYAVGAVSHLRDIAAGTTTTLSPAIEPGWAALSDDANALTFLDSNPVQTLYFADIAAGSITPLATSAGAQSTVASHDARFVATNAASPGVHRLNIYRIDRTGATPSSGFIDFDGDGVADDIGTGSGGFRDTIAGHPDTDGRYEPAAPRGAEVSDAPDPEGVNVRGGAFGATMSFCTGTFEASLDPDTTAVLTCGSLTARVISGQVNITAGDATVSIPAGVTGKVTDNHNGGFGVQNLGGGELTITAADGTTTNLPANTSTTVGTPAPSLPPTVTPTVTGTLGTNGWYRGSVTVTWAVDGGASPITTQTGCTTTTVTTDTPGQTFTCSATSEGGTTTQSVTVKRGATPPSAAFAAHAATYTVDQTVNFACVTTDAGSGVATACSGVTAPAWSFPPGLVTRTSTATDQAGNTRTATTTFTVTVTGASLCNLTKQFVQGSAKYIGATKLQKAAVDVVVGVGCVAANAVKPSMTAKQKAPLIAAYRATVLLLVAPGWLTGAQGTTLGTLAGAL